MLHCEKKTDHMISPEQTEKLWEMHLYTKLTTPWIKPGKKEYNSIFPEIWQSQSTVTLYHCYSMTGDVKVKLKGNEKINDTIITQITAKTCIKRTKRFILYHYMCI